MNIKKELIELVTPFGKPAELTKKIALSCTIGLVLLIWIFGDYTFFPSPIEIFDATIYMIRYLDLIANVWISVKLSIVSMIISTIISVLISYSVLIPLTQFWAKLFTYLRFLTIVGLSFFFTILTSQYNDAGYLLKLSLMVFFISTFFTTSFISAVQSIESNKYDYSRTLGLSKWKTFKQLIVNGKKYDLIDIIRQTFAISWAMLTMVEGLVRSGGGVGVMLLNSSRSFSLDRIFAICIIVILIGSLMNYLLEQLNRLINPHVYLLNKK